MDGIGQRPSRPGRRLHVLSVAGPGTWVDAGCDRPRLPRAGRGQHGRARAGRPARRPYATVRTVRPRRGPGRLARHGAGTARRGWAGPAHAHRHTGRRTSDA